MEVVAREARTDQPPSAEGEPEAEPPLADDITAPIRTGAKVEAEESTPLEAAPDAVSSLVDQDLSPPVTEPEVEPPKEIREPEPEVEPPEVDESETTSEAADYDSSITDVLEVPEEFASGPEVIDRIDEDFGSQAFEVSLPEKDDEPDTTPVMPDQGGADVTVTTDDEVVSGPRRRRLWPIGLGLVLVLAVAAGFLRPTVKTWLETRGDTQPASVSTTPVETGEAQPETEPPSDPEPAAVQPPAVDVAEESAEDETPVVEQAPAEPVVAAAEPEPVPEAAPATRADAVESIEIEAGAGGTTVTILGNGALEDGAVSMENLSSPPRVLVRLRGIRSVFRPFTIDASTAEVTQARIGHHTDRRPAELWVVLDLTGPGAEIGGIDIRGERVEFVVTRP
jgi:hypothetical protein